MSNTLVQIQPLDFAVTVWILTGDLTGALVSEARGWLADCYWDDFGPEDFEDEPVSVIQRGIERHYDGGVAQFVRDC
jgi:hypothetical protein